MLSIEEANALVPEVAMLVQEQLELGATIQRLIAELRELVPLEAQQPTDMVDITLRSEDAAEVRDLKSELGKLVRHYREGWRFVEGLGAIVKDTRTGLLDFYGKIDDRVVWLCWRPGDASIGHYHELDQGFSGQKPLEPVRRRMLN